MPPGAVYVGRPSLWGNPYTPAEAPSWFIPDWDGKDLPPAGSARQRTPDERRAWCVAKYREELTHFGLLSDYSAFVSSGRWDATCAAVNATGATCLAEYVPVALAGHDLVCWCPLDKPCHADLLLEIAGSGSQPGEPVER